MSPVLACKQGAAANKGTALRPLTSSPLWGNDPPAHPHKMDSAIYGGTER